MANQLFPLTDYETLVCALREARSPSQLQEVIIEHERQTAESEARNRAFAYYGMVTGAIAAWACFTAIYIYSLGVFS